MEIKRGRTYEGVHRLGTKLVRQTRRVTSVKFNGGNQIVFFVDHRNWNGNCSLADFERWAEHEIAPEGQEDLNHG
jgi:hypothetical protein